MHNSINILFVIKIEETWCLKNILNKTKNLSQKIRFNGDVYEQIEGVAMLPHKAPDLISISMGYHGQHWLKCHFRKVVLMIYSVNLKNVGL